MLRFYAKSISFSLIISMALLSCAPSRMEGDGRANVRIQLSDSALGTSSLGSIISSDYCYGLHATTPNDPFSLVMMNRQARDGDGGPKAECPYQPIGPGTLSKTLAAPGGSLSLELFLGPGRRIDLIAIPKNLLGGTCSHSLSFQADPDEPERTQILIGGRDFDDDQSIKVLAVSPLVTINPGENIVPLDKVASSAEGVDYLCEGGGDNGIRLVVPGQGNNGEVYTGLHEHFYMLSCPSTVTHVQMTISDVNEVRNRSGSALSPLSGGRYVVPCENRPDFKNQRMATFGLVRHVGGQYNGKVVRFLGLNNGVVSGVEKQMTLLASPQYAHLRGSANSTLSKSTSWDTGNNKPPKFAAAFRGGAVGYQRLIVKNYSSSGAALGPESFELLNSFGMAATSSENASIPALSTSGGTADIVRVGTSLLRIQNSSGFRAETSSGLSTAPYSFSNLYNVHTYAPVGTLTNGVSALHIADQNLGGGLYDCHIYFLGDSSVSTTLSSASSYQCSNYNPVLFKKFGDSEFKIVSADKVAAQFEYYSTGDSGTTWTKETKVLDAGGGPPAIDEIRNGLGSTLVAVWKTSISGMKTKLAAHSSAGLSAFYGPSTSNFYPPWGYTGDKIYFVKVLNLDELQGYAKSQLYLYDFSENEILAGGYVTVLGATRSVLYRSPDGGKNWYRVYTSSENDTKAVSAIPVVLDYGVTDDGAPYKRVGFAILETVGTSAYRILLQNYMGY